MADANTGIGVTERISLRVAVAATAATKSFPLPCDLTSYIATVLRGVENAAPHGIHLGDSRPANDVADIPSFERHATGFAISDSELCRRRQRNHVARRFINLDPLSAAAPELEDGKCRR